MNFPQITINGKKYPVSFKTSTVARLYREKGVALDQITNGMAGMDMVDMYDMIRLAVVDAAERERKEPPALTWMDIADWQSEQPKEFESTMGLIAESFGMTVEAEPEEKKRSSAKSKATKA